MTHLSVVLCCYESQRTVCSEQRLTLYTLTARCYEHAGPQRVTRALNLYLLTFNLYLFDDDGTLFSKYDLGAVFSLWVTAGHKQNCSPCTLQVHGLKHTNGLNWSVSVLGICARVNGNTCLFYQKQQLMTWNCFSE